MKVTFVYTDYGQFNQNNFNRGVAILSSCLKKAGFETDLIHIYRPLNKRGFIDLVKKSGPDLVAFSFITNMFSQVKKFSIWVKELGVPALHGGMHPTVAPEDCLSEEGIDAVCRGEGEGAIVDFCRAMESRGDIKNIPNIWVKQDGRIYENPCRLLIENLDSLPYPDYGIFQYENLEEGHIHKILVTQASRGCLYSCTYCCNPLLRSLYANKTRYLRYYTVDRLLDEIKWGLEKYPFLKEVRFYDDTLTQNKDWLGEFALKYKRRIGLPYSCNDRVDNIDPDTAGRLKDSGCYSVDLGIESGDKLIRERYMNRNVSDEKIIEAFTILKSCGIKANSFNILGMVGETPGSILKTIKLNAAVRPYIVFNAYFYPFKGTRSYGMVEERGYTVKEGISSFFEEPVVALDTITPSQLVFFYRYFYFLMGIYRGLWKAFRKNERAAVVLERILTSGYFPYTIFNFLHFGKEDVRAFLRKYPPLYLFVRRIYKRIKK